MLVVDDIIELNVLPEAAPNEDEVPGPVVDVVDDLRPGRVALRRHERHQRATVALCVRLPDVAELHREGLPDNHR